VRRSVTGTTPRTGMITWAFVWPQLRSREVDAQPSGTGRFPVPQFAGKIPTLAASVLVARCRTLERGLFFCLARWWSSSTLATGMFGGIPRRHLSATATCLSGTRGG